MRTILRTMHDRTYRRMTWPEQLREMNRERQQEHGQAAGLLRTLIWLQLAGFRERQARALVSMRERVRAGTYADDMTPA